MKKCLSCFYWLALTDADREKQKSATGLSIVSDGICRRYPSTVLKLKTDWCGEHTEISPINKALLALEEGLDRGKTTD